MDTDPVLDPGVLESLRQLTPQGEPDVLAEILNLFLEEVPKRILALQSALAAGDAPEVSRAAHSLKGSSGNIGAQSMLDVCRQLDDVARAGDLGSVAPLVASLTSEYHRVELEIRQLLQTS